ncbi:MAG: hypothetical protein J6R30_06105 [Bacteroidales bacterium]|nr:hypothetical protein [Bacteroidales bacterium]
MKDKEYKDDDVVVIGGAGWKPSPHGSSGKNDRKWKIIAILSAVGLFLLEGFFLGKHIYYNNQFNRSRPDSEIIAQLAFPMPGSAGVSIQHQAVMGVKMKIYALNGLKAHFTDTVPDYSDSSIYFITRSSDYRIKNDQKHIIGDYIVNGKIIAESLWRAGFMSVIDGNVQIGVSRSPKIRKHIAENSGSMFRQIALVSAGTRCDEQFVLKGKVTRCAYARDIEGNLYFVETENPETLYGFADALIEYGFADAIYITGGSQKECFYRSEDGTAHGKYTDEKPHELVVWTK